MPNKLVSRHYNFSIDNSFTLSLILIYNTHTLSPYIILTFTYNEWCIMGLTCVCKKKM